MLISLLAGFSAGAIHVVGGADHLVAMAPASLRRPGAALKAGLAWGLGHSTGVLCLSAIAIVVKDLAHIEQMSSWAEFIVGMALLVVGVLAIRNSLGLYIHTHRHRHGSEHAHEHVHLHLRGHTPHARQLHTRHPHAASSLGLLHGLAGASHLLAVIPALALPPLGAFGYLLAYLGGSIAAMAAVVTTISIASMRVGQRLFPCLLGLAGGLSIFTGCVWLHRTSLLVF